MAITVTFSSDWITIGLSGLSSPSLRKHVVRVPMAAVTAIRETGSTKDDRAPLGVAAPLTGVRSGVVERGGRRTLLVVEIGHPTFTIELDRTAYPEVPYDAIVLSTELAPRHRAGVPRGLRQ